MWLCIYGDSACWLEAFCEKIYITSNKCDQKIMSLVSVGDIGHWSQLDFVFLPQLNWCVCAPNMYGWTCVCECVCQQRVSTELSDSTYVIYMTFFSRLILIPVCNMEKISTDIGADYWTPDTKQTIVNTYQHQHQRGVEMRGACECKQKSNVRRTHIQ